MNILGICLSPGKGGLELYAHRAIEAMKLAGHQCHFAIQPESFLGQREWRTPLIEVKPKFRYLPLVIAHRLAKYIDTHDIDVIHMHWNKDLNLAVLAKSLSRRKPRLVYTRHMEITRSKLDLYHRILYKQLDRLFVISRFVQEQAYNYLPLPREKISLLYVGVAETKRASLSECRQLTQQDFNTNPAFVIGMIGRIEYGKAQHVLLEAVSLLKKEIPGLCIIMAGPIMDQAYFGKLKQQIEDKHLDEQVKYIGMTREPGKLMSCCDVVVLTTFCETFGLILAEAMRAGTAVIGTRAGGVLEIITDKETGLLYESGNAGELAQCLLNLHADPEIRDKLAAAGKKFADQMFNEKSHFEDLEQALIMETNERHG